MAWDIEPEFIVGGESFFITELDFARAYYTKKYEMLYFGQGMFGEDKNNEKSSHAAFIKKDGKYFAVILLTPEFSPRIYSEAKSIFGYGDVMFGQEIKELNKNNDFVALN